MSKLGTLFAIFTFSIIATLPFFAATVVLAAPVGQANADVVPGGRVLVPFVPDECYGKPTQGSGGVIQTNCGWEQLMQLGQNVINNAIVLAAIAAVISIAFAGYLLLTSEGDSGAIGRAKGILWNVVIGIALTMAAWLLVNTILKWLGVDSAFSLLAG